MSQIPDKVSKSFKRLNPGLFAVGVGQARAVNASLMVKKPMIRQRKGDGMNKWEREFYQILTSLNQNVHREVSLPLANGLRYKVDFIVGGKRLDGGSNVLGYEVKGFRRSTGIAKLKMAAALYTWITFYLVTREKGVWQYQEVNK